jgi:hypothetical protein
MRLRHAIIDAIIDFDYFRHCFQLSLISMPLRHDISLLMF